MADSRWPLPKMTEEKEDATKIRLHPNCFYYLYLSKKLGVHSNFFITNVGV